MLRLEALHLKTDQLQAAARKKRAEASKARTDARAARNSGDAVAAAARAKDAAALLQDAHNLRAQRLRLVIKVRHLQREAHCRTARDMTANYDTILHPPFRTKDMTQRIQQPRQGAAPAAAAAGGAPRRRRINKKAARRLLSLGHYKFRMLLKYRCLVDGSELHEPGEEYTTKACPFDGVCLDVGGSKRFCCTVCTPPFTADRDSKAAFAYCVKNLNVDPALWQ